MQPDDIARMMADGRPVDVEMETRTVNRHDTVADARRFAARIGLLAGAGTFAFTGWLMWLNDIPLPGWLFAVGAASFTALIVTWVASRVEMADLNDRATNWQRYTLAPQEPEQGRPVFERVAPRTARRVQSVSLPELQAICHAMLTPDGLLVARRLTRAQVAPLLTNYSERYGPFVRELYGLGWLDEQNDWTAAGVERLRHHAGFGGAE